MISIFISEFIKAGIKGHQNFDFVDVNLDDDTRLFIDPCMIEGAEDPWSVNASKIMRTYFDCIFEGFHKGNVRMTSLLSHAGEQNATKLGYGNGDNGKGKTEDGLWDSLKGLTTLIRDIPTISCSQDIPVLVEGFAEDGMSDLGDLSVTHIAFSRIVNGYIGEKKYYLCQSGLYAAITYLKHTNICTA